MMNHYTPRSQGGSSYQGGSYGSGSASGYGNVPPPSNISYGKYRETNLLGSLICPTGVNVHMD